jgi:nucleoside-diphosphate-sugar epimerase
MKCVISGSSGFIGSNLVEACLNKGWETIGIDNNIYLSTIVRKVEANSKEEAIGKFVLGTQSTESFKKVNLECIELSELISL